MAGPKHSGCSIPGYSSGFSGLQIKYSRKNMPSCFFVFFGKPLMFQASDIFGWGAINAKCMCGSKNEIADILHFLWLGIISRVIFKHLVSMGIWNSLHWKWSQKWEFVLGNSFANFTFLKITRFSKFVMFNLQVHGHLFNWCWCTANLCASDSQRKGEYNSLDSCNFKSQAVV